MITLYHQNDDVKHVFLFCDIGLFVIILICLLIRPNSAVRY